MDIIFKGENIFVKNEYITAVKINNKISSPKTYIITKKYDLYVVNEILIDYIPQEGKEKIYASNEKNELCERIEIILNSPGQKINPLNNGLEEYVKVIGIISVDMDIDAQMVDLNSQKELEITCVDANFFNERYSNMIKYEDLSYLDVVNLLELSKKKF